MITILKEEMYIKTGEEVNILKWNLDRQNLRLLGSE